ncbi:MAG TPA: hypothetical protein VK766_02860 [Cytophagaceae bacterium]|jgi:hypothetical protein|nr:hypothetical protein [Cytophagaceae bacterium]
MFGLTPLGIIHTAISLIALMTGSIALIRTQEISWKNLVGKIYVVTTFITCLTGFGIFQHGGFGKAHVLGIITIVVLEIALIAEIKKPFGKASLFIGTIGFSTTFFFHLIPAITETATRIPLSAPLASSPDDPRIQMAIGICFVLFLFGVAKQVKKIQSEKTK